MKKFYFTLKNMRNSWFINNNRVIRVDKNTKHSLVTKAQILFGDEAILIIALEPKRENYHVPYTAYYPYKIFSLSIEGKDHSGATIRYRFVVGVSDYAGNTESLHNAAFNKLQGLLMHEGIGVLLKDTKLNEMGEMALYDDFFNQ